MKEKEEKSKTKFEEVELIVHNEKTNEEELYRIPKESFKEMVRDATYFYITNRPSDDIWRYLGFSIVNKPVNEISPDYTPPKGRKGRPRKYSVINDEILEVDNTGSDWFLFAFALFMAVVGWYCLICGILAGGCWMLLAILFYIPFSFIFTYLVVRRLYCPIVILRFNRLKGTVELPEAWFKGWVGKTKTIPFRELKITLAGTTVKALNIAYPDDYFTAGLGLSENISLPLVVWFMDRNRPLPPGEIFDIYRMKDYERRKSAGFPPPLFPAAFASKELSPEYKPDISKLKLIKRIGTNEGVKEVEIDPESLYDV